MILFYNVDMTLPDNIKDMLWNLLEQETIKYFKKLSLWQGAKQKNSASAAKTILYLRLARVPTNAAEHI